MGIPDSKFSRASQRQVNGLRPTAAHEAVNPKKICCFFALIFGKSGKCRYWYVGKGNFLFSIKQLPKRLIVGKDRAAGKVLAGKSVIFAFCGVVGSKGRSPLAAFYIDLA